MFKSKFLVLCFLSSLSLIFASCSSSVKRADIPNTANPQQELAKLDMDINAAIAKNIDVLAPSEFSDVKKWSDEAKSDFTKGEKQEEVLNDLRNSRNALDKAYATSENREAKAPGLFQARQAALTAGAANHPQLRGDLRAADAAVSDKAADLATLSAEKITALQERYVNLEKRAVIADKLGNSQGILTGARKDGANKKAPQTFKKTELSLKNAESVISTNVRNPSGYEQAVTEANTDATLLMDVMATIKQNKNLSESAALKMVAQNSQIKSLKTDLSTTNASDAAAQAALQNKNRELSSELTDKDADLTNATAQVGIQKALESARTQFSPEEAEAYQQGGNLVIRMKNVNFASGRSDLPGASLASFAKVSEVAKSLNASEIKVEGHTDSIGTASVNKTISTQRANSVASYFKSNGFDNIDVQSEGYGFEKPIATNKSKAGRAQNRRVDIIITPDAAKSIQ